MDVCTTDVWRGQARLSQEVMLVGRWVCMCMMCEAGGRAGCARAGLGPALPTQAVLYRPNTGQRGAVGWGGQQGRQLCAHRRLGCRLVARLGNALLYALPHAGPMCFARAASHLPRRMMHPRARGAPPPARVPAPGLQLQGGRAGGGCFQCVDDGRFHVRPPPPPGMTHPPHESMWVPPSPSLAPVVGQPRLCMRCCLCHARPLPPAACPGRTPPQRRLDPHLLLFACSFKYAVHGARLPLPPAVGLFGIAGHGL